MDINQERNINIRKKKYRESFNRIKNYKEVKCRLFDIVLDIREKYREGSNVVSYSINPKSVGRKFIVMYINENSKLSKKILIHITSSSLTKDEIDISIFFINEEEEIIC